MAETPKPGTIRLSPNEAKALRALASADDPFFDFGYLSFKSIRRRSGLPAHLVRRTVRALARKGLAKYGRGLFTEDGEIAGAGYAITPLGLKVVANG